MADSIRLSAVLEVEVAHRSIGQECLGFAAGTRSASPLEGLSGLIDWDQFAVLLAGTHVHYGCVTGL